MAFIKQDTYLTSRASDLLAIATIAKKKYAVALEELNVAKKAFDLANADLEEDLEWEKYFAMEMPIETRVTTSWRDTALILTEWHSEVYNTTVTNAHGESFQDWIEITSYSRENAISDHLKMVAALSCRIKCK